MTLEFPSRGLYAITKTEGFSQKQIINSVSAAIRGGAKVIQYRDKSSLQQYTIAEKLLKICHQSKIPLIINDNITLAARIGADGVHLGKDDDDIATAKSKLGAPSIVGISCYNSPERAIRAEQQGASYIAFGRFFPSKSKPDASFASLEVLRKDQFNIPIVAIGGVSPENGRTLINAGADLLAVIERVCGDNDPEQSARRFQQLF